MTQFNFYFAVKRARGLKIKGKDGTNDAFVTIGLGKEKYQTSVKEKGVIYKMSLILSGRFVEKQALREFLKD